MRKMQISPAKTGSHPFGKQTRWSRTHKSQGLLPETKCSILLSAVKITFLCFCAVTCCQWLGAQERPLVHRFTDRNVDEGGWGSPMAWDREMPAHTLCPCCPPIYTPWARRPRAPTYGPGFWGLGLAIKSPGSSASQEREGRYRMTGLCREETGLRNFWEGQRSGKPKGTLSWIFLDHSIVSSVWPPGFHLTAQEAGRRSPRCDGEWVMSSLLCIAWIYDFW